MKENKEILKEIIRIKEEKDILILGHYYIPAILQDVADYVGDSLDLCQYAIAYQVDKVLFLGVRFMAETLKILNPSIQVFMADPNAGCSLASSIDPQAFREFLKQYPDHKVVTYINSSAEIKAMSDYTCTSSNASKVINSIPEYESIVFAPDRNLGQYLIKSTGRDMVLWNGECHVHQNYNISKIIDLNHLEPDAEIIAHPECAINLQSISDFVGSTSSMMSYIKESSSKSFIVATEEGVFHQMQKMAPDKEIIAAPTYNGCNDCIHMKNNTPDRVLAALQNEQNEITLSSDIITRARIPLLKMMKTI